MGATAAYNHCVFVPDEAQTEHKKREASITWLEFGS